MLSILLAALCALGLAGGLWFTSWAMRSNDRDVDSYGSEIDR